MHNPHQSPDLVIVEIDDSGPACPDNPDLYVGILRRDNRALRIFKIDESHFTTDFKFKSKTHMYYIVQKVAEVFNELGVEPENCLIRVCKTIHFLILKRWLSDNGFEYENSQIGDYLQYRLRKYGKTAVAETSENQED